MNLNLKVALAILLSTALASGAFGLEVGGGSGALAGADSSVRGSFQADGTGASSSMSSGGSVLNYVESHYVQDTTYKRAEVSLDVNSSAGAVVYKATLTPKEGDVSSAPSVSATQNVLVAKADCIKLHSAAKSSGSDVAGVNLTINRTGSYSASFTGTTSASATATSATARIDGKFGGSINRTAGYGGSSITGPYATTKYAGSTGRMVEGSMNMQSASKSGSGAIISTSAFNVGPAEKIQAAIDASFDGDTINIAKGTYRENLAIDSNLTLKGAGPGKTVVDGNKSGSVIAIGRKNVESSVVLSGMTVLHGNATYGGGIWNAGTAKLDTVTVSESRASQLGGAVCSSGTLTLTKSAVSGNSAYYGGGIYSNGTLTLTKSTVSGNSAYYGGGIYSSDTAIISGNTISGNFGSYGGGVYVAGNATLTGDAFIGNCGDNYGGAIMTEGHTTVDKITASGNYADYGGGILNDGDLTVTGSTFTGNTAYWEHGGAICNFRNMTVTKSTISGNAGGYGGGISNFNGNAILDKVTITGNSAKWGGGVANVGESRLEMTGCTISKNSATYGGAIYNIEGTTNVTGCTISGNTAHFGGGIYITQGATNVIGSQVAGNTAKISGGGICNYWNLTISGASQITGNKALAGFGGGIYSETPFISNVIFNGTKVKVSGNRAPLPASAGTWYQGYGVYASTKPGTSGGFNGATQVTGNTKA